MISASILQAAQKKLIKFFPLIITLGLFALLYAQIPQSENIDIFDKVVHIEGSTLIFLAINFAITLLLTSFRLKLAYRQFYVRLPFKASFEAVVSGAISSLFLLPFVGTILGQGVALRKVNAPAQITTLVCLYERIIMALSGLLVSFVTALILFPGFHSIEGVDLDHFIEIAGFMGLSFVFVLFIASHENKAALKLAFSKHHIGYFCASFLISLLSWSVMSIGYVRLLEDLAPEAPLLSLFGCALIVSFLSSLPLSVSGWGVREYASLLLFGLFGISATVALATAISIGLLSFVWLMLTAGFFYLWNKLPQKRKDAIIDPATPLNTNLISILMYGVVASICFQLHLKLDAFTLNLNFADIFALCALGLTLLDIIEKRFSLKSLGRPTYLFGLTATLALTLSLLLGFINFGFTSWAFYNKFLGWFIMWGYGLLAFRFYEEAGLDGVKRIIHLLMIILAVSTVYKVGLYALEGIGVLSNQFVQWPLTGFFANRTGFVLIACFVATTHLVLTKNLNKRDILLVSILYAGSMCSFARSAIFFLPIIPIFLFFTKAASGKTILNIILNTFMLYALMLAVIYYVPPLFNSGISALSDAQQFKAISTSFAKNTVSMHSDNERFYSLIEGFNLWLSQPLFGAGLGAFVQNELATNARMLVIHNTPLWLLAELGLIGTLPFILYFGYLFAVPFRSSASGFDVPKTLLILFVLFFGLMSMPHEILYQRIIWLVFGVVVASNKTLLGTMPFRKSALA